MLYAFFWVIPRRLKFICRHFGTLFHLHRQVGACRMNSAEGNIFCTLTRPPSLHCPSRPNGSDHFQAKPFPL